MKARVRKIVSGVALLLCAGCGGQRELPAVQPPGAQSPHNRGYTVLVQQTFESETTFVVIVPDAAKTDRQMLLAIANELHNTRGERPKTAVAFQVARKIPLPRLSLESQYADAFAVAAIDSAKGDQTLRFGTFN